MTSSLTTPRVDVPSLSMNETELMNVLRNSLYPGAKDESIKLVVSYCRASGLDPMQKPVHIVPMNVKDAQKDKYEWRDVVMPGIGLYRTQAVRTGAYAGVSEPEFGPDEEFTVGEFKMKVPLWCKVTVRRRLDDGQIGEYTAKELWRENYATAGKDTTAPNAMWKKRPYAQLAKCAEAQALRKAFPETGAQPTAEEMEGKSLDDAPVIECSARRVEEKTQQTLPTMDQSRFDGNLPAWTKLIRDTEKGKTASQIIATVSTKYALTSEQEAAIRKIETEFTGEAE